MTEDTNHDDAIDIAADHTVDAPAQPEQPAPEPPPDPRYRDLEIAVAEAAAEADGASEELARCCAEHDDAEAKFLAGDQSEAAFAVVEASRRTRDRVQLMSKGAKARHTAAKAALAGAVRGDKEARLAELRARRDVLPATVLAFADELAEMFTKALELNHRLRDVVADVHRDEREASPLAADLGVRWLRDRESVPDLPGVSRAIVDALAARFPVHQRNGGTTHAWRFAREALSACQDTLATYPAASSHSKEELR